MIEQRVYRTHLKQHFTGLRAFALHRATMDAPRLGGCISPAIDYTYSISDDGANYRNPTAAESVEFAREVARFCRDCGDARDQEVSAVVFPCGHVAHPECHLRSGKITCRYAGSVELEAMGDYMEILPED